MLSHQEIALRLFTAVILGGIVGLERERLEWVAGLRTHMLVCVGACLMMIVSAFGFADVLHQPQVVLDPSRVAAQVVSGIGFLGAGTILFLRQEIIRGLTTAASLWTIAGVGLAVGGGLYVAALCTTALIVVILAAVKPLERSLFGRNRSRQIVMTIDKERVSLTQIEARLLTSGIPVAEISFKQGDTPSEQTVRLTLVRSVARQRLLQLISELGELEGVQQVKL